MNGQIDLRDRWDIEHLAVLIMCLFLAWDFRILTWQSPTKEKVSLLQSKLGFYEWEGWKVFSEVTMPRLHKFFQKSLRTTTLNGWGQNLQLGFGKAWVRNGRSGKQSWHPWWHWPSCQFAVLSPAGRFQRFQKYITSSLRWNSFSRLLVGHSNSLLLRPAALPTGALDFRNSVFPNQHQKLPHELTQPTLF